MRHRAPRATNLTEIPPPPLLPPSISRRFALGAISGWSVNTRRAPPRHCRGAKIYGHTTTAMHDISTPPSCHSHVVPISLTCSASTKSEFFVDQLPDALSAMVLYSSSMKVRQPAAAAAAANTGRTCSRTAELGNYGAGVRMICTFCI